jgi:hypothetical protein
MPMQAVAVGYGTWGVNGTYWFINGDEERGIPRRLRLRRAQTSLGRMPNPLSIQASVLNPPRDKTSYHV